VDVTLGHGLLDATAHSTARTALDDRGTMFGQSKNDIFIDLEVAQRLRFGLWAASSERVCGQEGRKAWLVCVHGYRLFGHLLDAVADSGTKREAEKRRQTVGAIQQLANVSPPNIGGVSLDDR
jgi:hypothetical protein